MSVRGRFVCSAAALATLFASSLAAAPPAKPEAIFETNVTNDLAISSGEPQIGVDPNNPKNLAILEFGIGSKKVPAYSMNPVLEDTHGKWFEANANLGRLDLSRDGGNTWTSYPPPAYDPTVSPHIGGGDPMLAYGPDGSLYAANGVGKPPADGGRPGITPTLRNVRIMLNGSTDGGRTWGTPQNILTPRDRPWIVVDSTTGTVYTASTGPYNVKTKEYNVPGPDAPWDRWFEVWKPHLAGRSLPRRMGGPDFSAERGNTMIAANGVFATAYFIDGPTPPGRASVVMPPPRGYHAPAEIEVPPSLRDAVAGRVKTCSRQAPCLFFQTSDDEGQTWSRHYVPVPEGIAGNWVNVAADPGKPGRFAVGVISHYENSLVVSVTDDSGNSWSPPVHVPETAPPARDFKPWMAYGPTGVLGYIWKKERPDLAGGLVAPTGMFQAHGAAFDVYASVSCDGGFTWHPAVRVNAVTSPAGPAGFDDLSYLTLDDRYEHAVWGDRRNLSKVTNAKSGIGGVQAYYGRIPFSVFTQGAACGRQ